jgi:hypothetical protein
MTLREKLDEAVQSFKQKHQAQEDIQPWELETFLDDLVKIHNEAILPLRGPAGMLYLTDWYSAHYPQA